MAADRPAVGCAGAGVLGAAIMERLVDRGFTVRVWNRDPARLEPVLALGATAVPTPAALAAASDVVITCVTDGAAVEHVALGPHGVAEGGGPGKLLVDMSTCAAEQTRALGARLREACGMGWLDAPISGGAPAARAGTMAVMVGGDEADFDRARPVLDALAGRCTLMGPAGTGQTTKLINQVLVASTFTVLAEACNLAERAGVDAGRIPEALMGGRADSRLLQEFMPKMAASDFSIEGRIAIMVKDLDMIADLARSAGARIPVSELVARLHREAVDRGLGDRDNSELVRLYREDA